MTKYIFMALFLASTTYVCAGEKHLISMGEAYLKINSYSDTGSILSYRVKDGPRDNSVSKFFTKFDRPNKLNFTWVKKNPISGEEESHSIVEDGDSLISYLPKKPTTRERKSRISALSSLSGITSGTSFLVPMFLEYGYMEEKFERIESVVYMGEEVVNNHLCNVVKVKYLHGAVETLWLDKKTYLLWRFEDVFYSDRIKSDMRTIIEFTSVESN